MLVYYTNQLFEQSSFASKYLYISSLPEISRQLILLFDIDYQKHLQQFIEDLTRHYGEAKHTLENLIVILMVDDVKSKDITVFCQKVADKVFQKGFHNTYLKVGLSKNDHSNIEQIILSKDFSNLTPINPSSFATLSAFLSFWQQPNFVKQFEDIMGVSPLFRQLGLVFENKNRELNFWENQLFTCENLKSDINLVKKITISSENPFLEENEAKLRKYDHSINELKHFLQTTQMRLSTFAKRYIEQFENEKDDYHQKKVAFAKTLYDLLEKPNQKHLKLFLSNLNQNSSGARCKSDN